MNKINNVAGYYRAKNNHVFVQFNTDHMDIISNIITKRNQRIHIFDIYPLAITNLISWAIETVDGKAKLIFHIPSMLKDYAPVIRDWNKDLNKPYTISIDGADVEFSMIDHLPSNVYTPCYNNNSNGICRQLKVRYGRDRYCYQVSAAITTLHGMNLLPIAQYQSQGLFDTIPKQRYPELFRDTCIKRFKKMTPKGILEQFKDDDDIWNWMMDNLIHRPSANEEDDPEYDEDGTED